MKALLLTIAGLFLVMAVTAQAPSRIRLNAPRTINPQDEPIFIVNDSIITDMSCLDALNPNNIISVDVVKDSSYIATLGQKARNGVIIIRTNNKPMFLNLEPLLDQYHVAAQDRKLRVCIDNVLVKNRTRIALDPSEIQRIEVIKDICWKSPIEAGPEETYINIVTKKASKTTP